jgi:hypothetical protein
MLSWSGHTEGDEIDLAALGRGEAGTDLPLASELHAFAAAAVGDDEAELTRCRAVLLTAAGGGDAAEAVMVDAAAVVANFEMMTRLADGTGARFADDVSADRAALAAEVGAADLTSRR